jgi:uncharacterized protein
MDCPVCGERLKEIERSGVTIDICPSCKGIWLDRGEIDKLIQAEGGKVAPAGQERTDRVRSERMDHDDHDHKRQEDSRAYGQIPSPKRKSSLLQDLLGGLGGD